MIVAVWDSLLLAAVTTGCEVPLGVVEEVWIVNVALFWDGGRTFELVPLESFQLALAPAGRLEALSVTASANPFDGVTVTEYAVDWPWLTVWLDGEAAIEKSARPSRRRRNAVGAQPTDSRRTQNSVMQRVRLPLVFVLLRRVLTWFGLWVGVGGRGDGEGRWPKPPPSSRSWSTC